MRLAAGFILNQESGFILNQLGSIPLYMDHLMDFVLRSTGKVMEDHGIKGKNSPGLRLW